MFHHKEGRSCWPRRRGVQERRTDVVLAREDCGPRLRRRCRRILREELRRYGSRAGVREAKPRRCGVQGSLDCRELG